jgi:triosephosphate isomerase
MITKLYNRSIAEALPVLYGGSVNRENALGYLKESGMKGLLVGGASLKSEEFIGIVRDADNL